MQLDQDQLFNFFVPKQLDICMKQKLEIKPNASLPDSSFGTNNTPYLSSNDQIYMNLLNKYQLFSKDFY